MQEIASGIFVETAYAPYNLGLVTLENGILAIDMPPKPSDQRAWVEEIQSKLGKLRYVVVTDANPERLVAAASCSVPIIATRTTLHSVNNNEERLWHDYLQKAAERYPDEAGQITTLKRPQITISFNKNFKLYHRKSPLIFEITQGGAPGSLLISVPDQQLLFAGDTVAVDAPPTLEYTPDSKAWLNTLSQLVLRSDFNQIATGRGQTPISRGDLEQQREYLRIARRTARTLERLSESSGNITQVAQDLGQTLFNRMGQKAVKRIRKGLRNLIKEIQTQKALAQQLEAAAQAEAEAEAEKTATPET